LHANSKNIASPAQQGFQAPKFLFERIPFNPLLVLLALYVVVGFVPDYYLATVSVPKVGMGLIVEFHLTWMLVIVESIYFAKAYKKKFFEIIKSYDVSPVTLSRVARSFVRKRKMFVFFLALFEVYIIYAAIYSGYFYSPPADVAFPLYTWNATRTWGILMVFLFVPIWAEVFTAVWSGMLSTKRLSEELSVNTLETEDPLGLKPLSSLWTRLSLVNITILMIISAFDEIVWFGTTALLLLGLSIFLAVQFSIWRSLRRIKSRVIQELTESRKEWLGGFLRTMASPTLPEAQDGISAAFNARLDELGKTTTKMKTTLFSSRRMVALIAYVSAMGFVSLVEFGAVLNFWAGVP